MVSRFALAALMVYLKTQDTHLTVNSRMTQFMEESRKFEYARGTADATAVGVDKAVDVAERNAAKATEVAKEKAMNS